MFKLKVTTLCLHQFTIPDLPSKMEAQVAGRNIFADGFAYDSADDSYYPVHSLYRVQIIEDTPPPQPAS